VGVTGATSRLLAYWTREARDKPLFFCQIEAIETAMATGSGKTVVMAMLIAWQALNKLEDRHDARRPLAVNPSCLPSFRARCTACTTTNANLSSAGSPTRTRRPAA
jgi:hypothetical protein